MSFKIFGFRGADTSRAHFSAMISSNNALFRTPKAESTRSNLQFLESINYGCSKLFNPRLELGEPPRFMGTCVKVQNSSKINLPYYALIGRSAFLDANTQQLVTLSAMVPHTLGLNAELARLMQTNTESFEAAKQYFSETQPVELLSGIFGMDADQITGQYAEQALGVQSVEQNILARHAFPQAKELMELFDEFEKLDSQSNVNRTDFFLNQLKKAAHHFGLSVAPPNPENSEQSVWANLGDAAFSKNGLLSVVRRIGKDAFLRVLLIQPLNDARELNSSVIEIRPSSGGKNLSVNGAFHNTNSSESVLKASINFGESDAAPPSSTKMIQGEKTQLKTTLANFVDVMATALFAIEHSEPPNLLRPNS